MFPHASAMHVGGGSGVVIGTTFDPDDFSTGIALSNGNLTVTRSSGSSASYAMAKAGKCAGKWRFQVTIGSLASGEVSIGVGGPFINRASYPGKNAESIAYVSYGSVVQSDSGQGGGPPAFAAGDVIDVFVDVAAAKIWFAKNGVVTTGNPTAGTGGYSIAMTILGMFPVVHCANAGANVTANFSGPFTYSGPSSFSGWSHDQSADRDNWRAVMINIRGAGYFGHSFAELSVAQTSGGANQLAGATATAQEVYLTHVAANGIDGSTSTKWSSTNTANNRWFKADQGAHAARASRYLSIRGSAGGAGNELQAPRLFDVWFSHDNVSWSRGGASRTFSAFAATTPGELKELSLPDLM